MATMAYDVKEAERIFTEAGGHIENGREICAILLERWAPGENNQFSQLGEVSRAIATIVYGIADCWNKLIDGYNEAESERDAYAREMEESMGKDGVAESFGGIMP